MKPENRLWFSENKKKLYEEISRFTDPDNGRIMLNYNPIRKQELRPYIWGNAGLFTGETALLLAVGGIMDERQKNRTIKAVRAVQVNGGLFSRNPEPYRFSPNWKQVSFDEYLGVVYAAAAIPELRDVATQIVNHGKNNHWQFNDHPEFKSKSLLRLVLNIPTFWKNIKGYLKASNPEPIFDGFSHIILQIEDWIDSAKFRQNTINFPYLWPLFSGHQAHLRFMYKTVSPLHKPNLFERLFFSAKVVLAALKVDETYSDLSSTRMVFLNLLTLERMGENKGLLVGLASAFFDYRKSAQYESEFYYHEINDEYFEEKERIHAITTLSQGISL